MVGATDGLGLALARRYLGAGWRVGVVGRDPDKLARVLAELRAEEPDGVVEGVACDLADRERVVPALDELLVALGQMDLLVYCAGVMPPAAEGVSAGAEVEAMLRVNVLGAVQALEWAAAYFVLAGEGRLAAVGSVAGERGRKGHPAYGASKAALHQYLEGLRHRLHGTGVGVTAIKPGWVRTRMLPEALHGSPASVTPEAAADRVYRGLEQGRDVIWVPRFWGLVAWVLRALPTPLYKRMAPL